MTDTKNAKVHYPWREDNQFSLLVGGPEFFPRMLQVIASASETVLLEMYLIESGAVASRFIEAFCDAAERGVTVKLLLDDYGSMGLSHYDRGRLTHNNIQVAFYNRLSLGKLFNNMARDHRKILICDGEVAFTGGAGITDEFAPPDEEEDQWRETMLEIRGPVVADWQSLFNCVWTETTGQRAIEANLTPSPIEDGMLGRVATASGLRAQGIMRALVQRVRGSERRVWLSTAYFVPSWKLRRALRYAVKKGVDVRLLLPGPKTDHPAVRLAGRRYYAALLDHGVRIFEYQPRVLHSKALICDQWVSIGSSNFDRWNFRWNLEANQSVDDARFTEMVITMFERDFSDSVEIKAEQWLRRSSVARLREKFWGTVDLWLHKLGRGRR